jgi:hypothetical protein
MKVLGEYVVLKGANGITLNGDGDGEVSFKESAYTILFKGSFSELERSEYKYLI